MVCYYLPHILQRELNAVSLMSVSVYIKLLYTCRHPWYILLHSKKSITNDGDLLASKLCIAFDNMSYAGYNSRSFMHDTAIQMILILHDSCLLCKLHILDRKLDYISCPVLLYDSNVVFRHKSSRCQMPCIYFMEANSHDSLWIFYSVLHLE